MTEMNDATVTQLLALIRAEVRRRSLRASRHALAAAALWQARVWNRVGARGRGC